MGLLDLFNRNKPEPESELTLEPEPESEFELTLEPEPESEFELTLEEKSSDGFLRAMTPEDCADYIIAKLDNKGVLSWPNSSDFMEKNYDRVDRDEKVKILQRLGASSKRIFFVARQGDFHVPALSGASSITILVPEGIKNVTTDGHNKIWDMNDPTGKVKLYPDIARLLIDRGYTPKREQTSCPDGYWLDFVRKARTDEGYIHYNDFQKTPSLSQKGILTEEGYRTFAAHFVPVVKDASDIPIESLVIPIPVFNAKMESELGVNFCHELKVSDDGSSIRVIEKSPNHDLSLSHLRK